MDLPPRTPVTVRAGVDVPTPPQHSLPWPYTWDRVLGQSVTGVLWVAGLTVAAGLGGVALVPHHRRTVAGLPAAVRTAARARAGADSSTSAPRAVPKNGLTATLFYLAERELVELSRSTTSSGPSAAWSKPAEWVRSTRPAAVGIALKVNRPGSEFEAKKTVKSGEKLNKAKTDMAKAVQTWAFDGGLMVKRKQGTVGACRQRGRVYPDGVRRSSAGASRPPCGRCRSRRSSCFSARSWNDGVGTRRTAAGRELWSRAGGFHRMLATDSAEARFDFGARKDLYTAYVPFAVAAGAAALWAKKYRGVHG